MKNKTNYLLLLLLLFSIVSHGQSNRVVDVDTPSGGRILMSHDKNIIEGENSSKFLNLSIICEIDKRIEKYSLLLTSSANEVIRIPDNSKLIVRLFDGQVISSIATMVECDAIGSLGAFSMRYYTANAMYPISRANLQKMIKIGVSKMRVQHLDRNVDYIHESDIIGKAIEKDLALIDEAKSKDTFLDGF